MLNVRSVLKIQQPHKPKHRATSLRIHREKEIKRLQRENQELLNIQEETEVIITKKQFQDAAFRYVPTFLANIISNVSDLMDRKPKGRRYTEEFKEYALSIFYMSPKAYKKLMQDYGFPGRRTLSRMTENLIFTTGLNDFVLKTLAANLKNSKKTNRMCCLLMDEMSLKSNLFYCRNRDEVIGSFLFMELIFDVFYIL